MNHVCLFHINRQVHVIVWDDNTIIYVVAWFLRGVIFTPMLIIIIICSTITTCHHNSFPFPLVPYDPLWTSRASPFWPSPYVIGPLGHLLPFLSSERVSDLNTFCPSFFLYKRSLIDVLIHGPYSLLAFLPSFLSFITISQSVSWWLSLPQT